MIEIDDSGEKKASNDKKSICRHKGGKDWRNEVRTRASLELKGLESRPMFSVRPISTFISKF